MEEKTSFRLVFGNAPVVKVLDFFIDNQEFDYSLTDIAKGAEIAWSTLHTCWPELVNLGIIKKTRTIGRAELYKLDRDCPLVKRLLELDIFISEQYIEKEIGKEEIVA